MLCWNSLLKKPITVIQNMSEDVNISLKSMPILNEYIPAMRQYFQCTLKTLTRKASVI